jgi:DNA-binding transcriptional MerR regulator
MSLAKRKHGKVQPDAVIPDKIYFRIGEVSELSALPAYVLRYWETEFSQLKPIKSSTGQRMYRRKDVENVFRIRRLLYEEGFTIAGAREKLREEARLHQMAAPSKVAATGQIREIVNAKVTSTAQPMLPFLTTPPPRGAAHREELQRLRRQLRALLDELR